jgi:chromosome segregation ATPase
MIWLLLGFAVVSLIKYLTSIQISRMEHRLRDLKDELQQVANRLNVVLESQKRVVDKEKDLKDQMRATQDAIVDLQYRLTHCEDRALVNV